MSWALYPLHWAVYPIDWKSTQVPWAYLTVVWVIFPRVVGSIALIPGTSTNSLEVYQDTLVYTNVSWVLYPLHLAVYPTDWKST
jgi:hypothetical protein